MSYRETVVTCLPLKDGDEVVKGSDGQPLPLATTPSCPSQPMPMKDTPYRNFSYFSPYLYADPQEPETSSGVYTAGILTRGATLDQYYKPVNENDGINQQGACADQLSMAPAHMPKDLTGRAAWARLKADNCANQHILNAALRSYQKEHSIRFCNTANGLALCRLKDICQPFQPRIPTSEEYAVTDYLKMSWMNLLTNRKVASQPHLPAAVRVRGLLPPFVKQKDTDPAPPVDLEKHPITLSSIAALPYEEILDPSHPFSPRWDFKTNDRAYSSATKKYEEEPKDAVYCAGNRALATPDDDPKTPEVQKKNKRYLVDVLSFRQKKFQKDLMKRIGYNTSCFGGPTTLPVDISWWTKCSSVPEKTIDSWCWLFIPLIKIGGYCRGIFIKFSCWDCFGLSGKIGIDENPPCATRHDARDRKMKLFRYGIPRLPGGKNVYLIKAYCAKSPIQSSLSGYQPSMGSLVKLAMKPDAKQFINDYFDQFRPPKSMASLCSDLRSPFMMINKLKMRYYNPKDREPKEGETVPAGENPQIYKDTNTLNTASDASDRKTAEGLTFNQYFGNHMPYPRLWDTGKSIQQSESADQNPYDINGQYSTIVGVGREAATETMNADLKADSKPPRLEQRCGYGGWGGTVAMGPAVKFNEKSYDPITNWTELKLYQMNTKRITGMSCLGRYEKVFKPNSSENKMLLKAGSEVTLLLRKTCTKNAAGVETCAPPIEYAKAADTEADPLTPPADTRYEFSRETYAYPLAWRGYLSDTNEATRFPNFPSAAASGAIITGLSNAQCGDLVMMPEGIIDIENKKYGLPRVARVVDINLPNQRGCQETGKASNCDIRKDCFVEVQETDNGKVPDICGTTTTTGTIQTRRYYAPEMIPQDKKHEALRIGWTTSCADPSLKECEMSGAQWSSLELYRPSQDFRQGKDDPTQEPTTATAPPPP